MSGNYKSPSPLLTVKTRPLPENMEPDELSRTSITKYTKHYYIGTERIASALETMNNLGLLCENVWPGSQDIIDEMGDKTAVATEILIADYNIFEKELQLPEPYRYETYICTKLEHDAENYDAYWYHPDHLGSSSYITNLAGEVSQHMEYLPFGETLVEEHLNSYNSPYKFNAKEYDAGTGWYYYGARYYNPKWSIWLSVDPMSARRQSWSPYAYVLQNPINRIDPYGLTDYKINKETGEITEVRLDNENTDRILKTDKHGNIKRKGEGFLGFLVKKENRGKAKVAVDKIAKGILKDGLNLKENDGSFNVNGEEQPTLDEFNKFISEFSDYIGKEIAGVRLGRDKNSDNVARVLTYRYKESTKTESQTPRSWFSRYGDYLKGHFHTHPYGDHTPSENYDIPLRNAYPNLPFFIIAGGYEEEY